MKSTENQTQEYDMKEVDKILNTPGFKKEFDFEETDINKIRKSIFSNTNDRRKKR
jgi:hypothetical protein